MTPSSCRATEVALDALFSRVAERGWGPYPRSRDEILRPTSRRRPPSRSATTGGATRTRTASWPIGPQFADVQPFRDGVAWVRPVGIETWGLIAEDGRLLIDPRAGYLGVGSFSDDLAWVSRDGQAGWFAIDKANRVVIQSGFDDVRPFRRGIAIVRQQGKWGAVEKNGRLAVQFAFDGFATGLADGRYVDGFTDEGLAIVEVGGRKGVIDRTGRVHRSAGLPDPRHPPGGVPVHRPEPALGRDRPRRAAADRPGPRQPEGGRRRARAAARRHPSDAVMRAAGPAGWRIGSRSWNSVILAAPACSSARSRTATGSPTAHRSRRTPPPPASGPPWTPASPPSTPPTSTRAPAPRPSSAARCKGERREGPGDLHQGLLADRPGSQRPRPVPQAHHGVDQRLAAPAADRLRRPLPGPPVRLPTPLEETMEAFADVVRSGKALYIGVSEWTADQIRAAHEPGPRAEHPARLQPAAVLDALAGHRGRGGPDQRGARRRPDRLVADRPGRADRQVPARAAATRRVRGPPTRSRARASSAGSWPTTC